MKNKKYSLPFSKARLPGCHGEALRNIKTELDPDPRIILTCTFYSESPSMDPYVHNAYMTHIYRRSLGRELSLSE
jgi:hypothetical protein